MGFREGSYAKIWSSEDKGNYSVANVSISKKNKDTNEYSVEFQDGFVRLVGTAHELIKDMDIPKNGLSVKITSCDVTNNYDQSKKKLYTNFAIFGLEVMDGNGSNSSKSSKAGTSSKKSKTKASSKKADDIDDMVDDEDDLPF